MEGYSCHVCDFAVCSSQLFKSHVQGHRELEGKTISNVMLSCRHLLQKKFTRGQSYYPINMEAVGLFYNGENVSTLTGEISASLEVKRIIECTRKKIFRLDSISPSIENHNTYTSMFYAKADFMKIAQDTRENRTALSKLVTVSSNGTHTEDFIISEGLECVKHMNDNIGKACGSLLIRINSIGKNRDTAVNRSRAFQKVTISYDVYYSM